jgi:5'-3' exonuclease
LSKLNVSDGTCVRVNYSEVLERIGLDSDSFLDFCIMCGTDYNKNINLIGPVKAVKLLGLYKNIENINTKCKIGEETWDNKQKKCVKKSNKSYYMSYYVFMACLLVILSYFKYWIIFLIILLIILIFTLFNYNSIKNS